MGELLDKRLIRPSPCPPTPTGVQGMWGWQVGGRGQVVEEVGGQTGGGLGYPRGWHHHTSGGTKGWGYPQRGNRGGMEGRRVIP